MVYKLTDKQIADIIAKYKSGQSIRNIQLEVPYSYSFIRRLLIRNKVPLRGRGGSVKLWNEEYKKIAEFHHKVNKAVTEFTQEKRQYCTEECTCKFSVYDFMDWLNEPVD